MKAQESRILELTALYENEKQQLLNLKEATDERVSRKEADVLYARLERYELERAELKSAIHNYKYLYSAAMAQAKQLSLNLEKQKALIQPSQTSFSNDPQLLIGKLSFELMTSQWNEAEVNKKNDELANKVRC